MSKPLHVAVVIGTRPEAIKMAPVIEALAGRSGTMRTSVLSTGQHREMLAQVLALYGITPDADLGLMTPDQTLSGLTRAAIGGLTDCLATLRPDMLLVQGDTTTVFAAALTAFYLGLPVGHVEAGLRSHDLAHPFPEEANRRLTSVLTALHFAPTPLARDELTREGHAPDRILVTGQTGVDALLALSRRLGPGRPALLAGRVPDRARLVLVTSHRRESWGQGLANICAAVRELARDFPDVAFVYPVHRNPHVRQAVFPILSGQANVHLVDPLDYPAFVTLMREACCILTDSGGVQEEAPTFRTPVLVLRTVTERPEASRLGLSKLVGTDREAIVRETSRLLTDETARQAMRRAGNPYGDGRAAERIARALERFAAGASPVLPEADQFHPGEPMPS